MLGRDDERIYVGGLDPSRGLTVELVASRLGAVQGVEILSINDVPTNNEDVRNITDRKPMYKVRSPIVDEDGDLVDNRNFFYVVARVAATAMTGESSAPAASALELLAKQYNGVKWKGCNLRVEAARPHFLKRLEEERALRDGDKQEDVIPHKSSSKEEKEAIKNRRRLRIRKRFGEEAFHVDTLPHPLDICQDASHEDIDGWDQFATLHKRMQDKWQSQYKKLIDKRKKDRRMWASKEGTGKKEPASASTTNAENGDDLRSLIFLNRGIHVRFGDIDVAGKREIVKCIAPVDTESVVSSSVASTDSDESEHEMKTNKGRDAYVWSDDDDECGDIDDEAAAHAGEQIKQGRQYAWSDEADDTDESDKSHQREGKHTARHSETTSSIISQGRQKITNGFNYATAVAIDEFSGGIDFDFAQNDFDVELAADSDVNNCNDSGSESGDASLTCLDDDIRSNMDVLALLFPGEHFDNRPLAPSIASGSGGGDNNIRERSDVHRSPVFGAGLIIQRYDPTKEADNMFKLPQASKDHINSVSRAPPKVMDEGKVNENREHASMCGESSDDENSMQQATKLEKQNHTPRDISTGDKKTTMKTDKAGARDVVEQDELKELGNLFGKESENIPPKPSDLDDREVYEQDKLEDVFKQARGDDARMGGFAFGFLNQESGNNVDDEEDKNYPTPKPNDHDEREIYEQGKLEDVFKHARYNDAGTSGFTFGFLKQEPGANIVDVDGGSLGFDHATRGTLERGTFNGETKADAIQNAASMTEEAASEMIPEIEVKERPRNKKTRGRKSFSQSDLDEYEKLFFSLNEGPQILGDLEGMRHNEENQEQWLKERQILTDDWKRKQKSALSKKGKKARR